MQSRSEKPDRNRIRLTVPVAVATFLGEVLLPFEYLGWGDHLPVALGVLLERGPCARFTGPLNPRPARVGRAAPQAPSTEPGGEPRLAHAQPAAVLPTTEGHWDRETDSVSYGSGEEA
jgi:hypothetical protein